MASFYPLIVNPTAPATQRIQELPAGDTLNFSDTSITNLAVGNLNIIGGVTGQILRTDGAGAPSSDWSNQFVPGSDNIYGQFVANQIAAIGNIGPWTITANGIAWDAVAHDATLIAGNRYLLQACVLTAAAGGGGGQCSWTWWNADTATTLTGFQNVVHVGNSLNTISSVIVTGIFEPTINTRVALRCTQGSTGGVQTFWAGPDSSGTNFRIFRLV